LKFSVESNGKNLSTDDEFSFLNSLNSLLHKEEILIIIRWLLWEEMLNCFMERLHKNRVVLQCWFGYKLRILSRLEENY